MRLYRLAQLAGLFVAISQPVLAASCAEEIAALDARLRKQATSAISSSSGSKEAASSREAEAVTARNNDVPVSAMPRAAEAGSSEAKATEDAEKAGGGGDRVMEARATLNRAHLLNEKGDASGCMQAIAEARTQLER